MSALIQIVIPTFERHELLLRSLQYWSSSPFEIFIVDGSQRPIFESECVDEFPNVRYYHLPVSLQERLLFASTIINKKYAALISDDEFYSIEGLTHAAEILDNSKRTSAVVGATLAFKSLKQKFVGRIEYPSAKDLKISGKTALERIRRRVEVPGNSIFYCLTRADTLKVALRLIGEYRYSCPYVSEYQMEAVLCCAGDVAIMPWLLWFRSREGAMINTPDFDRSILFNRWLSSSVTAFELKKVQHDFEKFAKQVDASCNVTGFEFIEIFEKFEILSNAKHSLATRIINLIRNPSKLNEKIRNIIILGGPKDGYSSICKLLAILERNGINYSNSELENVVQILEDSWKSKPFSQTNFS